MVDEEGESLYPKVIIFFSYNEVIDYAAKKLTHYNPLILRGQTNKFDRKLSVDRFNETNSKYRLLIANIDVGEHL
jgi:SNF2 family DNA or RNA helicase